MINCREIIRFSITKTILSNKVLWYSLAILAILQLLVTYAPFMHVALGTTVITGQHIGISV